MIVGLEAGGYSAWFERFLEDLGIEVWVGNPTEIRRRARSRQKNDWRDAELLLDLLIKNEFPRIFRQSAQARSVLGQLLYRQKLVQMRTQTINSLHALLIREGLSLQSKLLTKSGREKLLAHPLTVEQAKQRDEWLGLIDQLSDNIQLTSDGRSQ